MKIAEGIWRLDASGSYGCYLAAAANEYTLIDTGYAKQGGAIEAEVEAILASGTSGVGGDGGVTGRPASVRRILITHHDVDHIGNAARFQRRWDCPVFIGAADIPYAIGKRRREGIKAVIGAIAQTDNTTQYTSVEGKRFSGITVVPTPGHTPGHTCYLVRGVLFSGDLVRLRDGQVIASRRRMNWDTSRLMESIAEVDTLPWHTLAPAHFPPRPRAECGPAFHD